MKHINDVNNQNVIVGCVGFCLIVGLLMGDLYFYSCK